MALTLDRFISNSSYGDLSQFVILAGSGISVPSGLPSGWEFNTKLAAFLSSSSADEEELRSMLITGYGSSNHVVRFEQVMYVLRERIDPNLTILSSFDRGSPTMLHAFLAEALKQNAFVFTTNFDSLIEGAFQQQGSSYASPGRLLQVYLEDETEEKDSQSCKSFERYLHRGLPHPALLKLHGTLQDIHVQSEPLNPSGQSSIGATLDRIGARGGAMRLEPHKHATLEAALKGRVLCVIGYSGSDDFDVIPSLVEALASAAGLLWLRHEDHPLEVLDMNMGEGLELLPERISSSALPVSSFIVRGLTDEAINKLFGFSSTNHTRTALPPLESVLRSLAPYKALQNHYKKIVAGRIAEEALRLDIALVRYNEASELSRRRDSSAYAYTLFRRGHIQRIIGDDTNALLCLNRALKIFRRLNDRANTALVLNALGNVFLVRGELNRAEAKYGAALVESANLGHRRFEATVLNNIGLIWKKRGEFTRAIEYYDRALAIDGDIRDRAGMVRELGNKVNALILLGKYNEAITFCDETAANQRLLGRLDLLAVSLTSRGIALRHLGRADEAAQAAEEALQIERALGRKEGIAQCISLLGGIAASRRNWREAIEHYKEAVSIQKTIGRPEGVAVDLESLGECYVTIGDHCSAASSFSESHSYYQKLGNQRKASEVKRKAAEAQLQISQ